MRAALRGGVGARAREDGLERRRRRHSPRSRGWLREVSFRATLRAAAAQVMVVGVGEEEAFAVDAVRALGGPYIDAA